LSGRSWQIFEKRNIDPSQPNQKTSQALVVRDYCTANNRGSDSVDEFRHGHVSQGCRLQATVRLYPTSSYPGPENCKRILARGILYLAVRFTLEFETSATIFNGN